MSNIKNILLVGVGGQGTILASKILCEGLLRQGYDVKMSEVHGMAQRGGSVVTQIRFGEKIYSPLIEKGKADVIVAFEKSEALRYLSHLSQDGYIIVNDCEIYPITVSIGGEKYPENINENLLSQVPNTIIINAAKIAEELGNIRVQNVVLLGALIKILKLNNISWEQIIETAVAVKVVEINKKAFKAGINI